MRGITIFISVLICLISISINSFAATYYVNPGQSIQAAINGATHGDTVIVSQGTYTENIFFNGKNIVLTSTDPDSPAIVAATIIDGSGNTSAVTIDSGEASTCVMTGFTITNSSGRGVLCINSSPSITNCIFDRNQASLDGGGMRNYNSNPMLKNCIFSDNTANFGGGMYNENSSPVLTNCEFRRNSAKEGGGIQNEINGNPVLTNCIFSDNSALWRGGGVNNFDDGNPVLINCLFIGNSSDQGGGIGNYYNSNPVITNSILWDNLNEIYNDATSSTTVSYSNVKGGWPGEGNIDANPLFVNVAGGNYRFQAGSPCVDSGHKFANAGGYDLDGNPRYVDASDSSGWGGAIKAMVVDDDDTIHLAWASIDMGAYEYQTACTPLKFRLQSRNDLDSGSWQDRYNGFVGTWSDTEAVGLGKRFYRVIGDYVIEQLVEEIPAPDALTMLGERSGDDCFTVLDVRTPGEHATRHIIGAINIDFYSSTFADQLNALDKGRTYLVHCASGYRSGQTVQMMESLGFVEVYDLLGGFDAFQSIPGSDAYLEP